jgi:hypothetical protein
MTDEPPHNEPDEIVTLAHCPGCEQLTLPADLTDGARDGPSDQLFCSRCGTRVNAESFHDYANLEVATYDGR